MKLKTKAIIIGTAGALVVTGAIAIAQAVKRHAKRVLNRKIRKVLDEIVVMRAEDFIPGGDKNKSLFIEFASHLDNTQLAILCTLVQVGYFIKVSNIDPLHPSKADIQQAISKFRIEERLVPSTRPGLLSALDSTDTREALITAFRVLKNA